MPSRPDATVRVAVPAGDPAGVGPVILEHLLAEGGPPPGTSWHVIGPPRWLDTLPAPPRVELVPAGAAALRPRPGSPSVPQARAALAALDTAADGCRRGRWDAVAGGPVSKIWMHRAGWAFPGQTEHFAARWGGEPVMAFAGGRLVVTLATWHIPLRAVPRAVTRARVGRACRAAAQLCARLGRARGAIAVCGLNPHAGEGGLLGTEERDRIDPWLDALRADIPGLSPCLPADTVFRRALLGEFDAVVALYHDQALAPLKAVEFEEAVNVTWGLPFVRTSPDHGTAFDRAASGAVSTASFRRAIDLAAQLARGLG